MSTPSDSDSDSFAENDDFIRVYCNRVEQNDYSSYSFYKSINLDRVKNDPLIFSDSTFRKMTNETILIAAVVQNNVDFLKDIPKSPDWYDIKDLRDGNSLLQIGIIQKRKEVCDYLLSVPNFPLDCRNYERMTALDLALYETDDFCDYISCELIRKGVSLDSVSLDDGTTLLHYSLDRSLVKLSKLLMEMGYDVNAVTNSNLSPLWCCLEANSKDETEIELVTSLLYYGADPTVGTILEYNIFEYAVKFCAFPVEEALFYYIFDRYTRVNIHFEVLLTLADERSPFFYETVKQTNAVILGRSSLKYYHLLFLIDVEYLEALIKKCGDVIAQVFAQVTSLDYKMCSFCEKMSLRNLNVLLESDLRRDTINFIVTFGDKFYFYALIGFGSEESIVIENVCYLLSYGLKLNESHLKAFYKRYGYGELVKIVLHMDIEKKLGREYIKGSLLIFLYDVNMTLDRYLQDPSPLHRRYVHELFPYFVHPGLQKLMSYYKMAEDTYVPSNQSDVPLLVELARNVFRTYFVETFKIKSAKQFYGLINGLPIPRYYKKIITYETKLY